MVYSNSSIPVKLLVGVYKIVEFAIDTIKPSELKASVDMIVAFSGISLAKTSRVVAVSTSTEKLSFVASAG